MALAWNPSANATGYNVKQSSACGGPYTTAATNLAGLTFTNNGLLKGATYYFTVSAVNLAGESANAAAVNAQPVSLTPPQVSLAVNDGQMQLNWPPDHTTWPLVVQTNTAGEGLGTNWLTVPGSTTTNQMSFPIDPTVGSVFFRLVYP